MTALTATYAYGVLESASRLTAGRAPAGVPGATRPRLMPLHGRLWLIAAEVPVSVYGENVLNANIRDLEWVSAVAVGHEAVIEHFARLRRATVAPMKLLTLFSSEEKARDELRRRRRELDSAIRRIAGCEEWGVRVFASPSGAPERTGSASAPASRPTSGTAFLAARKAARDAEKEGRARALAAADGVFESLAGFARAAKQRPRSSEPGTNPPLLDGAFLVPASSRAGFKRAARRQAAVCAAAGARLTLTGPWPAYNFVGDSDETA